MEAFEIYVAGSQYLVEPFLQNDCCSYVVDIGREKVMFLPDEKGGDGLIAIHAPSVDEEFLQEIANAIDNHEM